MKGKIIMRLRRRHKTKFENECNHNEEDFYGTVRLFGVEGDLYFYTDEYGRQRYCFRHGEQGAYTTGLKDRCQRITNLMEKKATGRELYYGKSCKRYA